MEDSFKISNSDQANAATLRFLINFFKSSRGEEEKRKRLPKYTEAISEADSSKWKISFENINTTSCDR